MHVAVVCVRNGPKLKNICNFHVSTEYEFSSFLHANLVISHCIVYPKTPKYEYSSN